LFLQFCCRLFTVPARLRLAVTLRSPTPPRVTTVTFICDFAVPVPIPCRTTVPMLSPFARVLHIRTCGCCAAAPVTYRLVPFFACACRTRLRFAASSLVWFAALLRAWLVTLVLVAPTLPLVCTGYGLLSPPTMPRRFCRWTLQVGYRGSRDAQRCAFCAARITVRAYRAQVHTLCLTGSVRTTHARFPTLRLLTPAFRAFTTALNLQRGYARTRFVRCWLCRLTGYATLLVDASVAFSLQCVVPPCAAHYTPPHYPIPYARVRGPAYARYTLRLHLA